jgi:Caspase domain
MQQFFANAWGSLQSSVQQFTNRFGEPLVAAFVSVVTGAVTAAVTGNVVAGAQIAATGVGKLVVEILRSPPPETVTAKSFRHQTVSFFTRFTFLLMSPLTIAILVVLVVMIGIAALITRLTAPQPLESALLQKVEPPSVLDFTVKSAVRNRFAIVAIDKWKDGTTLSGCEHDGANMARRIMEMYQVPEADIGYILDRYYKSNDGCHLQLIHNDAEFRLVRNNRATRKELLESLHWLREDLHDDNARLFYDTGHGSQTPDPNELDKLNECVRAYDHDWNDETTWFLDDDVYGILGGITAKAEFIIMLDTCHSEGFLKGSCAKFDAPPAYLTVGRTLKKSQAQGRSPYDDHINDNVLLLSGCASDSFCYVNQYPQPDGTTVRESAFTREFLAEHAKTPLATLQELHARYQATLLNSQYKQEPCIQGSERLKNKPFLIGA